MAEHHDSSHPSSPATSTPPSPHEHNQRELKAAKDRNCPFCGQAFTSSSLGRHLDLYIKPKNPKPSDGVHDVDEIRRIRGSITRRQPRTGGGSIGGGGSGGGKEDGGSVTREREGRRTWEGASVVGSKDRKRGQEEERTKYTDRGYVNSPVEREGGMQTSFNTANWQATGVINNLPARAPSRSLNGTPSGGAQAQRMQEMRRDTAGHRIERPDYVADDTWKLHEQAEIGKAAEMALREVLGSLEAARRKAEPRTMYEDFDYCSLSFPALCLQILPPPATLFSADPFAQPHTWALVPPGDEQLKALTRMLNERTTWIRNGRPENLPDSVIFKHHVHLTAAYEHWQTLSEAEQYRIWTLELSRALVGEKGRKTDLKKELENAKQRIHHLEAEFDRLSRCQLPREYLLHPPNTLPISPQVIREMPAAHAKSASAEASYDIEILLDKWKAAVKSTARPARNNTQRMSVAPTTEYYTETTRNPMKGDMIMNGSVLNIGGPMPRAAEGIDDLGRVRYEYETPSVPGQVVDADEDGVGTDAEGEVEEPQRDERALMRTRGGRIGDEFCAPVYGMVNQNGKRTMTEAEMGNGDGGGGGGGKRGGARVYREM